MHFELIKQFDVNFKGGLVLGIFKDEPLPDYLVSLNQATNGLLHILAQDLRDLGDNRWQNQVLDKTLLLVQCGPKAEFNRQQLAKCIACVIPQLLKHNTSAMTLCFPRTQDENADNQLEQMLLQMDYDLFQQLDFKTKKAKINRLKTVNIYLPEATDTGLSNAIAIAEGVRLTRVLANLPANICTPAYLSEQALALSTSYKKIKTSVIERETMREMGMGALLAVAQGSIQPPKLIELQFLNGGNKPAIVLVGKGITFDSGGISIKTGNGMEEMKYDMAGAASVLGVLKACALLDLPINLIGLMACAENMPSGSAVKPGDIVTSMSGQTIEIVNTDAEGRLVLADALTYAERFNPQFVIDIATLTGAVIVALGHVASGFMTQDAQLAERISKASDTSGDRAWRLPMDAAYEDALESTLADMVNATYDRTAGSVTAACFLARFTGKYPWAHLDIAGTAWISGKKRTATGRPVPLLMQLLRQAVHAN